MGDSQGRSAWPQTLGNPSQRRPWEGEIPVGSWERAPVAAGCRALVCVQVGVGFRSALYCDCRWVAIGVALQSALRCGRPCNALGLVMRSALPRPAACVRMPRQAAWAGAGARGRLPPARLPAKLELAAARPRSDLAHPAHRCEPLVTPLAASLSLRTPHYAHRCKPTSRTPRAIPSLNCQRLSTTVEPFPVSSHPCPASVVEANAAPERLSCQSPR